MHNSCHTSTTSSEVDRWTGRSDLGHGTISEIGTATVFLFTNDPSRKAVRRRKVRQRAGFALKSSPSVGV
jgi:hypothetical protein